MDAVERQLISALNGQLRQIEAAENALAKAKAQGAKIDAQIADLETRLAVLQADNVRDLAKLKARGAPAPTGGGS